MSLIKGLPKKPELPELTEQVVDITTMSNTELLKHILELYRLKYKLLGIEDKLKYSSCKDFYKGIDRGFWECERTINELLGRLENKDNVQSN